MSGLVGKELEESSKNIASIDPEQIWNIANALVKVFRSGGKLIVFGNGGSAADAQHLAAEFSGRYLMERAPMNAIALTNLSSITAIGNDYSYDMIFERQVEAHATKNDAVIGISTSGNSKNVLKAIEKAKQLGALTIGFTGTKGRLKDEADLVLTIPSERPPGSRKVISRQVISSAAWWRRVCSPERRSSSTGTTRWPRTCPTAAGRRTCGCSRASGGQ